MQSEGTRKLFRTCTQGELFGEASLEEVSEGAGFGSGVSEHRQIESLGLIFESDEARRDYFAERLREKLSDPEFRRMPGFPIGDDEAILRLSDPPYYTACPNPFLAEFVEHYGKPYDPSVPYQVEPFAVDVSEGKTDPLYRAHGYHTITTSVDLLRTLLELHGGRRALPPVLADFLVTRLRQRLAFGDWPLDRLVTERSAFLTFLQERWPRYVDQWLTQLDGSARGPKRAADPSVRYEVAGPSDLPFGADLVRPYVDTLFLEGVLTPIDVPELEAADRKQAAAAWLAVGLRSDPAVARARRLARLLESLEGAVPELEARHQDWLAFARAWAELKVLQLDGLAELDAALDGRIALLTERVDTAFLDWVGRRYAALYSQGGADPVMVHHVARAMARRVECSREARAALLVLDGLALDQWIIVRDVLARQRSGLAFHESAVFAWLPTITSVSRQSIFAGKPPMHFPTSIGTTAREPTLWGQFWTDNGLAAAEVGYLRSLGDPGTLAGVDELLARPRIRVVGLVVDTVDEIMHGMQLGAAGMHNQVRQWAEQGFFAGLLDRLLESGFDVFLTADHGNVEAIGCGNPAEAALAVSRGERVRIYANELLRAQVKERIPSAVEWSPVGLPLNYLPLLAPGRSAFIPLGERRVSHGGISVEEVIVPFVRIERRDA